MAHFLNMPKCCSSCLADDATRSWRIVAETNEVDWESGKDITRRHRVNVPLCNACCFQLWLKCGLFALAGIGLGGAASWALLQYGPGFLDTYGLLTSHSMLVIMLSGPFIALGLGYSLRKEIVDDSLARYNPKQGRIVFENEHYQELFDAANPYSTTQRRSSLGV